VRSSVSSPSCLTAPPHSSNSHRRSWILAKLSEPKAMAQAGLQACPHQRVQSLSPNM
jgi:hypothetical protein